VRCLTTQEQWHLNLRLIAAASWFLFVRLTSVSVLRRRYDIDMTKCIYCGELQLGPLVDDVQLLLCASCMNTARWSSAASSCAPAID
jgi:hypothetical protein